MRTPVRTAGRRVSFRRADAAVALAAALVFAVESLAWPLQWGRDPATYALYYHDFWNQPAVHPMLMAFRTPGTPFAIVPLVDHLGAAAAEFVFGALYVLSVVALHRAAAAWGRRAGIACAIAVLAYVPYSALFHTASSDALFAAGVALLAWLVAATARRPVPAAYAALGAAVFLLTMVRPGAVALLLAVALLPFFTPRVDLRRRLVLAGTSTLVALVLLAGWSAHNALRYDDFTISRGSSAVVPFYRLWIEGLVEPDNGGASRELAAAVEADVVTREPYVTYEIDRETFFDAATPRMWDDLVALSDRRRGWDSDYALLGAVAREAVLAHPVPYARAVTRSLASYLLTVRSPYHPAPGDARPARRNDPLDPVRLPQPGSDDVIPAANTWWLLSSPDGRVATRWLDGDTYVLEFDDAATRRRYRDVHAAAARTIDELRPHTRSEATATFLGRIDELYPAVIVWLVAGVAALVIRRPAGAAAPAVLAAGGLVVVAGTAVGLPTVYEYRLPVDPLFVLFACVALFGPSGRATVDGVHDPTPTGEAV